MTVIPVAKARWGLGGGSGKNGIAGRREGMGGGGGVIVQPVGFSEVSNGESRFRPILTPRAWLAIPAVSGLLAPAPPPPPPRSGPLSLPTSTITPRTTRNSPPSP